MNVLKTTVLAAVFTLIPAARGDDAKSVPSPRSVVQALAESGKPGPDHARLQPFVGDWTFRLKLWTDPAQPPAEMTGTIERQWIMGGRFVRETVSGECDGQRFEGLGLLGYDAAQKKYTSVRACSLCGKTFNGVLTLDSSGRRFECATEECCPLSGQTVKGRDELMVESHDRIVMTSFKTIDGKELKAMELVAVRKK